MANVQVSAVIGSSTVFVTVQCRCERCPKAISVRSSIALLEVEVKLDCLRGMRRATVENGAACSLTSRAVLNIVAVKLQPDQEAHRKRFCNLSCSVKDALILLEGRFSVSLDVIQFGQEVCS